ncbi:MAG: hypothetical protein ACRCWI_00860 [Brevinema sp.]
MDFKKLFDTYTDKLNTSERSNIFTQSVSPDNLDTLQSFVENYDSNADRNLENPSQLNTPPVVENNKPVEMSKGILDALSSLDTSQARSQNEKFNDFDDLSEENNDDLDTPESEDNSNTNFDDLLEDNIDSNFEDIEQIENNNNLDTPELEDNSNTNFDNLLEDDLDLSSFLDEMGDSNYEVDDTPEVFFDEEQITDPGNSDSFSIELFEEFYEEPIQDKETELEEQTNELPNFNNTEMENRLETPKIDEDFAPTKYENIDKSINFDVWDTHRQSSTDSLLELNEEQIFKIRYKINSLSNQAIRFKIREIIADPDSHKEFYDTLMSLLLVDTSESDLNKFFEQLKDSQDDESYPTLDIPQYTPSFLAPDVLNYQDTIYQIKNEFFYNLKKYFLYGLIAILTGIITWLGVAQPIQVNSIFEKGLTAIRNDNFIEGEALFAQANKIAGAPVAEWYMKYADVYKDKNLIAHAESKYLSALVIQPKNITIATHTSDFYTNLGSKYFTNAIIVMQNIAGYYPKRFEVWNYLGSLFINYSDFFTNDRDQQTGFLYDAIDVYQKFIVNNPKNPAPFYQMLDIYIRIGNKEQIDKIAYLLAQLNPKYIDINMMNRLAKYYTDNRNLTGVSQVFRKIEPLLESYSQDIIPLQKSMKQLYNIDPNSISNILSESYYELARYKMLSADFKAAGLLLTNSLLFNPAQENSYNLLGEVYMRSAENTQIKLSKAQELFDQALAINPNNYKAHINLGHLNYIWDQELGNVNTSRNKALYHYKFASTIMPTNVKNPLLSYNYGWLEYQNDNAPAAIEIWSDMYKMNLDNPVLSYALGSALFQSGNPQLAQVVLNKTADHLERLKQNIPAPDINNRRHREVYTQLAKVYNNIGVINANYGIANQGRREYFDSQALLNFYKAQDLADQINNIYSTAEYNIGVLTRPNIPNRKTVFDKDIPKQTSLENPTGYFNQLLLQNI